MTREQIDECVKKTIEIFDSGFSCAESVLLGGCRGLSVESELVPRLATGFAAGVSRTMSICGAVSGAVMVLSAKYGRNSPGDDRSLLMEKVQLLMKEFRERFGSENCYDLTGLDFNKSEDQMVYKERIHGTCKLYVEFCIRRALELSVD